AQRPDGMASRHISATIFLRYARKPPRAFLGGRRIIKKKTKPGTSPGSNPWRDKNDVRNGAAADLARFEDDQGDRGGDSGAAVVDSARHGPRSGRRAPTEAALGRAGARRRLGSRADGRRTGPVDSLRLALRGPDGGGERADGHFVSAVREDRSLPARDALGRWPGDAGSAFARDFRRRGLSDRSAPTGHVCGAEVRRA